VHTSGAGVAQHMQQEQGKECPVIDTHSRSSTSVIPHAQQEWRDEMQHNEMRAVGAVGMPVGPIDTKARRGGEGPTCTQIEDLDKRHRTQTPPQQMTHKWKSTSPSLQMFEERTA
jgi:hypothetical protein